MALSCFVSLPDGMLFSYLCDLLSLTWGDTSIPSTLEVPARAVTESHAGQLKFLLRCNRRPASRGMCPRRNTKSFLRVLQPDRSRPCTELMHVSRMIGDVPT